MYDTLVSRSESALWQSMQLSYARSIHPFMLSSVLVSTQGMSRDMPYPRVFLQG